MGSEAPWIKGLGFHIGTLIGDGGEPPSYGYGQSSPHDQRLISAATGTQCLSPRPGCFFSLLSGGRSRDALTSCHCNIVAWPMEPLVGGGWGEHQQHMLAPNIDLYQSLVIVMTNEP